MAIALVQTTSGTSGATPSSFARTFASPTTAGSLLVACVVWDGGNQIDTVTDSNGNTYSAAISAQFSTVWGCAVFYKENAAGGSSNVVTASSSGGSTGRTGMAIAEYSGVATSGSLDQTSKNDLGGSSTTPTSGNVTTALAGELYLGVLVCNTATITGEGGWSDLYNVTDMGDTLGGAAQYLIGGAGGTFAATWTLGTAGFWTTAIATFKAASSPPPASGAFPFFQQSMAGGFNSGYRGLVG